MIVTQQDKTKMETQIKNTREAQTESAEKVDKMIKRFKRDYRKSMAKMRLSKRTLYEAQRKINLIYSAGDGYYIEVPMFSLDSSQEYRIGRETKRYQMAKKFEILMKRDYLANRLIAGGKIYEPVNYLSENKIISRDHQAGSAIKCNLDLEAMTRVINTVNSLIKAVSSPLGGRDKITQNMLDVVGLEDYCLSSFKVSQYRAKEITISEWEAYKQEHLNPEKPLASHKTEKCPVIGCNATGYYHIRM